MPQPPCVSGCVCVVAACLIYIRLRHVSYILRHVSYIYVWYAAFICVKGLRRVRVCVVAACLIYIRRSPSSTKSFHTYEHIWLSHIWMRHITLRSECMEADVCTYACVRKSVCVIEARLTNDEVLSHTWMRHITIRSAQKMFWICYIIVYIFLSSVYGWGLRASGLWLWV